MPAVLMNMYVRDSGTFPRNVWWENGVNRVEVGIPGETRRGVLAPEVLARMQKGSDADGMTQALLTGEYKTVRSMLPSDQDLTEKPIGETELFAPGRQGKIPVTCYRTEDTSVLRPALIFLHGGGFVMGSRRSVEHSMRFIAQYSGAAIFSVEYRLAPEHPFPCAVDDAWSALRWVYRNAAQIGVDRARIMIGGDSSGGNLAAACARRDRNMRTRMLSGQLLVYPVLSQCEPNVPGYRFSIGDYEIGEDHKRWIQPAIFSLKNAMDGLRLYTRSSEEERLPDASPLLDSNFAGLPPTWLYCAEFDYLTQQAKAYANLLAAAGTRVTLMVYRGMVHGFMNRLGQYPQSVLLHREMAEVLRQSVSKQ